MTENPLIYGLWGIAFGFVLSVPVGPVNIICLRRSLFGRARDGFAIGLSAALGDAFYAALAAFGMQAIFSLINAHALLLKLVGGVVMFVFAVKIWREQPHLEEKALEGGLLKGSVGALALTVMNPGIFLGFVGLYSLAGLGDLTGMAHPLNKESVLLSLGVFIGAGFWWALLASTARFFRDKINDHFLVIINHCSAGLIGVFALAAWGSALVSS